MKSISTFPKIKFYGCAVCVALCPTSAISMCIEEGFYLRFYYPRVDNDKCI